MKHFIPEISVAALLVILAALLWNPYWMPMGMVLVVLVLFVIIAGGFAIFVWKEKGGDERDLLIRHVASRFSYLASALILGIGIVYQTLDRHLVDPWLIVAFIVIVAAKVAGHIYGKMKY